WQMVSGIVDGVPMKRALIQLVRRVTEGSVTTVTAGPQTLLRFEFTADGSASPQAIDYLHLEGTHRGKRQLVIYALERGTLTILMGAPGGARPTAFTARPPAGGTLTVWKRS